MLACDLCVFSVDGEPCTRRNSPQRTQRGTRELETIPVGLAGVTNAATEVRYDQKIEVGAVSTLFKEERSKNRQA